MGVMKTISGYLCIIFIEIYNDLKINKNKVEKVDYEGKA